MEKQLFEWVEYDTVDDMCLSFYNCTLKEDIGEYQKGTHFDTICVDYNKGKIELYNNDTGDVQATFELKFQIGDKIV